MSDLSATGAKKKKRERRVAVTVNNRGRREPSATWIFPAPHSPCLLSLSHRGTWSPPPCRGGCSPDLSWRLFLPYFFPISSAASLPPFSVFLFLSSCSHAFTHPHTCACYSPPVCANSVVLSFCLFTPPTQNVSVLFALSTCLPLYQATNQQTTTQSHVAPAH